jgi:hypothetical protein
MKQNKKKTICWCIGIAAAAVIMICIYCLCRPKASVGSKNVELEVVDDQNEIKTYQIQTDGEYLSDVMDELTKTSDFTYQGSTSSYGLYIETVNGVTADFSKDGAYWSIYVNGEYGQYSADQQPVQDKDEFKLVYAK